MNSRPAMPTYRVGALRYGWTRKQRLKRVRRYRSRLRQASKPKLEDYL